VAREDYERELARPDRFVQPGDVVVDGGASFGIYTVAAGRLAGVAGRALSFEPSPEAMVILHRNVALNHLGNVRLCQCALSDGDGEAHLYHYADSGPVSYAIPLARPSRASGLAGKSREALQPEAESAPEAAGSGPNLSDVFSSRRRRTLGYNSPARA
jgi:FkbM family methyltransferase